MQPQHLIWTVHGQLGQIEMTFQIYQGSTTQPPVETVSCSSSDTPIADLATSTQDQTYTVRGVITADYRYANGFSGFYIQTPDTKARANVSNAIFVYIPNSSAIKADKLAMKLFCVVV